MLLYADNFATLHKLPTTYVGGSALSDTQKHYIMDALCAYGLCSDPIYFSNNVIGMNVETFDSTACLGFRGYSSYTSTGTQWLHKKIAPRGNTLRFSMRASFAALVGAACPFMAIGYERLEAHTDGYLYLNGVDTGILYFEDGLPFWQYLELEVTPEVTNFYAQGNKVCSTTRTLAMLPSFVEVYGPTNTTMYVSQIAIADDFGDYNQINGRRIVATCNTVGVDCDGQSNRPDGYTLLGAIATPMQNYFADASDTVAEGRDYQGNFTFDDSVNGSLLVEVGDNVVGRCMNVVARSPERNLGGKKLVAFLETDGRAYGASGSISSACSSMLSLEVPVFTGTLATVGFTLLSYTDSNVWAEDGVYGSSEAATYAPQWTNLGDFATSYAGVESTDFNAVQTGFVATSFVTGSTAVENTGWNTVQTGYVADSLTTSATTVENTSFVEDV